MMEQMERHDYATCELCGLLPLAPHLNGVTHVVAHSEAMQVLLRRAGRFAHSGAPVAVVGETGTGKEVVARILHANSPRADHPFVPVNVAALPAELLESELFGHGEGAFTGATTARRGLFEAADRGTIFLDEIAEMPLSLQVKLLRVLQDGEIRRVGESRPFSVDVRIVCATHRDLAQSVREGAFREDLFYRLWVLTLEVPPLRARRDDILPLASNFLALESERLRGFTAAARDSLVAYDWPGNVRELQSAIKYAAALATGVHVDVDDLPETLTRRPLPVARMPRPASRHDLRPLADIEREHILHVLEACGGSQSAAARALGIGRNTLWRKLRTYDDLPVAVRDVP